MGRPVIGLSPLCNVSTINQWHRTKALLKVNKSTYVAERRCPISPEGERDHRAQICSTIVATPKVFTQGEKKP